MNTFTQPVARVARSVSKRRPWWALAVVAVAALVVGGVSGWALRGSNSSQAEKNVSHTQSQPATSVAAVAAFKNGFEKGDDSVVNLFTRDGIITTASNIYGLYNGDKRELGQWSVDSPGFWSLVYSHGGQTMTILGKPIVVQAPGYDKTVAFGFRWGGGNRPTLTGSGVTGTILLHLRNGKIAEAIIDPSQVPIGKS